MIAEVDQTECSDNEDTIYQCGLHWALFLGPALLIVFGGLSAPARGWPALVIVAVGLAWGIVSYINFCRSYLHVTNKRVVIRVGILARGPYSIAIDDIAYVDFYQPSLGSVLNFGKITIIEGAKNRIVLRMIASPGQFVAAVKDQISLSRTKD